MIIGYFRAALAGLLLATGGTAVAASPAGTYRLHDGPDVASEMVLRPDGTFRYFLIAGSLDEMAEGTWKLDGRSLRLTTLPKPVAAVFSVKSLAMTTDAPLELHVVGTGGGGIAAVDFRIGFDVGDPVEGYTQDYGWKLSPDEKRVPRWVEFEVAIYQLKSQRFPIDVAKGNVLTVLLTPNDLGKTDFSAMQVDFEPGRLVVHRGAGLMEFVLAR